MPSWLFQKVDRWQGEKDGVILFNFFYVEMVGVTFYIKLRKNRHIITFADFKVIHTSEPISSLIATLEDDDMRRFAWWFHEE